MWASPAEIIPLFLCVSVVGSEHSGSPQKHKRHREFAIQVHPYQMVRSQERIFKEKPGI